MSTTFSTDPDASTVASAWSSAPSEDPSFTDDPDARAKTGALKLFTASCLIAGVAALGAVLFTGPDPVDVVVPGVTGTDLAPAAPTLPSPIVATPPVSEAPAAPTPQPKPVASAPSAPASPAPEAPTPPPGPSVPAFDDVIVLPPLPPLPPLADPNPKPPIIKTPPPNVGPPIIKTPPPYVDPPIFKAPLQPVSPDPPKPTFNGPTDLTDQ